MKRHHKLSNQVTSGNQKQRDYTVSLPGELLAWVIENVEGMNRTQAKNLLKHGAIAVNGVVAGRHDEQLKAGDVVGIGGGGSPARVASLPFKILFEDKHLVVIDKPAGMLTVGTENEKERTAHRIMGELLRSRGEGMGRVFVVHRLDRETSGVLLLAKTEDVKRKMQAGWDSTTKDYCAVVEGVLEPREGTLVHWLYEDPAGLRVHVVAENPGAKRAVTHYRVVDVGRGCCRVALQIETGRKHQIRVQLAAAGHPVLGDDRYGNAGVARRLMLHAEKITFVHPVSGEKVVVAAPLPKEFTPSTWA